MMTEKELRQEIEAALNASTELLTLIPGGVNWLGNEEASGFPKIVLTKIDTEGVYIFGLAETSQDVTFQIDIISKSGRPYLMDDIVELTRGIMIQLCYRNIPSGAEEFDETTQKVTRSMRWERYNV